MVRLTDKDAGYARLIHRVFDLTKSKPRISVGILTGERKTPGDGAASLDASDIHPNKDAAALKAKADEAFGQAAKVRASADAATAKAWKADEKAANASTVKRGLYSKADKAGARADKAHFRAAKIRARAAKALVLARRVSRVASAAASGVKKEPVTLIQIAAWNEFGTWNTPARSFIRAWFDENSGRMREVLVPQMQAVVEGKFLADVALERVGLWAVGQIQRRIASGIDPANAPITIKRKGSSKPLIDTGLLRSSISYRVEF